MRKIKGQKKVQIWLEYLNYCNDVIDRVQVAEFLNRNWAEDYIEKVLTEEVSWLNEHTRFSIEEV